MASTDCDSKWKKFAAFLGIIEGFVWTILALICIILYHENWTLKQPGSYPEYIETMMRGFFLTANLKGFYGQVMTSDVFGAFVWIHFCLNICWVIDSVFLLRRDTLKVRRSWAFCTLFIAFWDFLTFVILAADYSKCLSSVGGFELQMSCAAAILPPFVIAAKGFTLWIINIVVGVYIYKTITK